MLAEIVAHLEGGGSLGLKTKLTRRAWHQLLDVCRVEGRAPRTLDEFRALRAMAQLEENRNRFAARWRRAVESLGGPAVETLGRLPERAAQGYAEEIRTRLEWRATVWEPLIDELRAAGFRWEVWLADASARARRSWRTGAGAASRVARTGGNRRGAGCADAPSRVVSSFATAADVSRRFSAERSGSTFLLQAQDSWDAETYEEACRELARLEGLREIYDNTPRFAGAARKCCSQHGRTPSPTRHKPHDAPAAPGRCDRRLALAAVAPGTGEARCRLDDGAARAARQDRG